MIAAGLGIVYDSQGRALPLFGAGLDSDAFDALFVAGDPTNPRVDLLIVQILDEDLGTWDIELVVGTPDASPVAPDVPVNAGLIAQADVPAAAESWADCSFTDARQLLEPAGWFDGGTIHQPLIVAPPELGGVTFFQVTNEEADVIFKVVGEDPPYVILYDSAGLSEYNRPAFDLSNDPTATLQLPAEVSDPPTAADFNALLGVVRSLIDRDLLLGSATSE